MRKREAQNGKLPFMIPAGMKMRYPATRWQEALPTGSGVVGALVYGNIQNDTILLNHDALYFPRGCPVVADVSDKLLAMRQMIDAGQCREAAQLLRDTYTERAASNAHPVDPYQPFCAVRISAATDGPFHGYRRGVDFETGLIQVGWSDAAATFTREVFVSRLTDVVHLRMRGTQPQSVSCSLSIGKVTNEQAGMKLTHTGLTPEDIETGTSERVSANGQMLSFVGGYADGTSFGAVGWVNILGGTMRADAGKLAIEQADEVVLRIRMFVGGDAEVELARLERELAGGSSLFDQAFAEHAAAHRELFSRVKLELAAGDVRSNEELLMEAYDGLPPVCLIQRMFDYGRYLLICSSRQGGWPCNLQGIWNGDYAPAWACDIHLDENIQMNYWPALQGGLAETLLPLFDYCERFLDDFRENARTNFGCRGILLPIAMTTHGVVTSLAYSSWTAAAGWIAQHYYDYYLFTGDKEFLRRRALPWMREVALFYEDFLDEGPDGKLRFIPSISPENRPGNGNSLVTVNATMDVAICREVLGNLCEASELLGIASDDVAHWRSMQARLPDYGVNGDGAMKEWLHPAFEDNYRHRHQSHIYPVFPGFEVTRESNPAIYEACRVAVEKRLVIGLTSQTGWSMAHMANIYARLGQGDRALECLDILLRSSVGPNLFTYHNDWRLMGLSSGRGEVPPFQIDANFGMAAAVMEMLVFSKPGLIKILPALPSKWTSGRVSGLCCRGGITVDLEWGAGFLTISLTSKTDQRIQLHLPPLAGSMVFSPAANASSFTKGCWDVSLERRLPLHIKSPKVNGVEVD